MEGNEIGAVSVVRRDAGHLDQGVETGDDKIQTDLGSLGEVELTGYANGLIRDRVEEGY